MDKQITLYNATTAQQIYDLVATGLSVNTHLVEYIYGYYNETPLHSACERENLEVVKAICESGLNKEYLNLALYEITPIMVAAKKDNLEMVKYLVSKGANISNVLITICYEGYEDILDYILTLKLDINIEKSLLHNACRGGHINFIEKLLINGANPNIEYLCKYEYVTYVPLTSVTYSLETILHICKLLVAYGANYYYIDNIGNSILHYLFFEFVYFSNELLYDRIDTLKFLVGMGCDINLRNNNGNTPFTQICINTIKDDHDYDITPILRELGANID